MGPEDRINADGESEDKSGGIPGLDLDHAVDEGKKFANKKVPYSKPIPRNFQAQWNEMEAEDMEQVEALNAFVNQLIETTPGAVPLNEVAPNAIILYGKMISVECEYCIACVCVFLEKYVRKEHNLTHCGRNEEKILIYNRVFFFF